MLAASVTDLRIEDPIQRDTLHMLSQKLRPSRFFHVSLYRYLPGAFALKLICQHLSLIRLGCMPNSLECAATMPDFIHLKALVCFEKYPVPDLSYQSLDHSRLWSRTGSISSSDGHAFKTERSNQAQQRQDRLQSQHRRVNYGFTE